MTNLAAAAAALILHVLGLWAVVPANLQSALEHQAAPAAAKRIVQPPPIALKTGQAALQLNADTSAYAVDPATGQVLFAANADKPRPIASVTKVMTVLVALNRYQPTDVITIGKLPPYQTEDETLGLATGQQFATIDLVKAALIPSDNDAADALAIATSGSVSEFARLMNTKAAQWQISGAHFTNSSGLIDTNLVSAAAMAKIAELALTNPVIKTVVTQPSATIYDQSGRYYNLTTTNTLLASGKFYGIKTGYTLAAGECFVGLAKINGHDVITVVLGSTDRFGETTSLTNWIGANYTWP